ncbi:T9SS type A sorting domain-containing protein [candidate division KSB1 bacterium]|nr:T9SS type A sorting domain-containing protein [candidate division KSB1 bacterium]
MNGIFLDENNGWLTSNWPDSGRIWQTTNGGRNWRVSRKGELAYLTIINFFDRLNGFVKVETFNKPRKHYVLKTNNGGNTWREIAVPNFTAITYLDTLNGFAGAIDAIYQTTDGGYSWLPVRVDTNAVFYITKFYFFNEDNGWASGINMHYTDTGILLNTTDGGKTWHIRMAQAYLIHDIEFVDSLNGVIVGGNMRGAAKIQVTNDGGITWVTHHLYGPTLTDIEFIDKNHGWAIGYYGFIFKTNDGGENWEKVESGTDEHLVNMCFVENGTVGYIFCSNKTLLKYDRETDIDDGSPNIIVSYNYPNPFIKSTILTYRLLENDNINISIYDITGRLVENLYSGLQEQGVHSVNWNPSNISSGIYFFHIKTSRSTEVRKVLLLN